MVVTGDSKSFSLGSNPSRPTMKIIYEVLEDYPFYGTIYETWNYVADVLCGCSPKEYGMYWKEIIKENATIHDLLKLINECVYIKKVKWK